MLEDAMRNDIKLQINWDRLIRQYVSNETIVNVDGVAGKTVTGRRSHYIVEERIINAERINANSVLNTRLNDHIDLSFGASFQKQKNNYYKEVNDLLGGEFYIDLNQFAERDYPLDPNANQNDLNRPNRILAVGDRFGYDYDMHINKIAAWGQGVFKFSKLDLFLAAELSRTHSGEWVM
jgi:hypothetical protein